jgi:hypothetical protein
MVVSRPHVLRVRLSLSVAAGGKLSAGRWRTRRDARAVGRPAGGPHLRAGKRQPVVCHGARGRPRRLRCQAQQRVTSSAVGRMPIVNCALAGMMSLAAVEVVLAHQPAEREEQVEVAEGPLGRTVRQATAPFQDAQAIATNLAEGWGCSPTWDVGTVRKSPTATPTRQTPALMLLLA